MYVVKLGGSLGDDLAGITSDVVMLAARGEAVVLVHGGSLEADRLATELRHPVRYLTTPSGRRSRYTDPASLAILTQAMVGRVKPMIVARLAQSGLRPIGMTGLDGGLIEAVRNPVCRAVVDGRWQVVRNDMTGRIRHVNADVLRVLLAVGYIPVISPPGLDPDAGPLNIDADRLAAAIAVALRAKHLITLSNVPGLLRDPTDPSTLVPALSPRTFEHYLTFAQGRMRVKLQAALEALTGGVPHVVLGDGRVPSPIRAAMEGSGTTLVPEREKETLHT